MSIFPCGICGNEDRDDDGLLTCDRDHLADDSSQLRASMDLQARGFANALARIRELEAALLQNRRREGRQALAEARVLGRTATKNGPLQGGAGYRVRGFMYVVTSSAKAGVT